MSISAYLAGAMQHLLDVLDIEEDTIFQSPDLDDDDDLHEYTHHRSASKRSLTEEHVRTSFRRSFKWTSRWSRNSDASSSRSLTPSDSDPHANHSGNESEGDHSASRSPSWDFRQSVEAKSRPSSDRVPRIHSRSPSAGAVQNVHSREASDGGASTTSMEHLHRRYPSSEIEQPASRIHTHARSPSGNLMSHLKRKIGKSGSTRLEEQIIHQTSDELQHELDQPDSFLQRLISHSESFPEKVAFYWLNNKGNEQERVTYQQFTTQCVAIAQMLLGEWGLVPGDRAMLVFVPGLDFARAFVACLLARVVAVPVYPPDPRNPGKGMKKLLAAYKVSGATVALTDKTFVKAKRMQELLRNGPPYPKRKHLRWIVVGANTVSSALRMQLKPELPGLVDTVDKNALAFVQFTSGSTGDPKGVMISMRALEANLYSHMVTMDTTSDDIGCAWVPHYHDMGLVSSLLHGLYAGGTAVYMSPLTFLKRPLMWLQAVSKYKATLSPAPNFAYDLCVRDLEKNPDILEKLDLSRCVRWGNGGEPVLGRTLRGFAEAFKSVGVMYEHLMPTYGAAENVILISCRHGRTPLHVNTLRLAADSLSAGDKIEIIVDDDVHNNKPTMEVVSNGKPVHGVDVVVAVNEEVSQHEGVVGELWVLGASNALGYYGREDATYETFRSGKVGERYAYRTGDLGFLWQREVYICGRLKDVLIVRGDNYYPHDIEDTAYHADKTHIRGGCVAVFQTGAENDMVVVVAEVRPLKVKTKANEQTLLHQIATGIRDNIRRVHGVDVDKVCLVSPRTVPKTTSGKVRHTEVKSMYHSNKIKSLFQLSPHDTLQAQIPLARVDGAGNDTDVDEQGSGRSQLVEQPPPELDSDKLEDWLSAKIAMLAQVEENLVDHDTELTTLGLTSMTVVGLANLLEEVASVDVPVSFIATHNTVSAIVDGLRELVQEDSEEGAGKKPDITLSLSNRRASIQLPKVLFDCMQVFGVLVIWLLLFVAILPVYQYGYWVQVTLNQEPWSYFAIGDTPMYGPLIPLLIPLWMTSFTLMVVVCKWVVIGRYQEGTIDMQSVSFFRWWWMDRLISVWEQFVGSFITGTVLLSFVYIMFGADVSLTTKFNSFIREFDLVSIGARTSLSASIITRVFDAKSRTLRSRRVVVGTDCSLESFAAIMPGCLVADGVRLCPIAVLVEGSHTIQGTTYSRNPARAIPKTLTEDEEKDKTKFGSPEGGFKRKSADSPFLMFLKLLSMFLCTYMFFYAMTPIVMLWDKYARAPDGSFGSKYNYFLFWTTSVLFAGLLQLPIAIFTKWILVGRVKPGVPSNNSFIVASKWLVDFQFKVVLFTGGKLYSDCGPLTALVMRLYGAHIHHTARFLPIWNFVPSQADLLYVGEQSFVSNAIILTELASGELVRTFLNEKTEVGLRAVVEGGCSIGVDAQVGPLTFIPERTDVAKATRRVGSTRMTKPRRKSRMPFSPLRRLSKALVSNQKNGRRSSHVANRITQQKTVSDVEKSPDTISIRVENGNSELGEVSPHQQQKQLNSSYSSLRIGSTLKRTRLTVSSKLGKLARAFAGEESSCDVVMEVLKSIGCSEGSGIDVSNIPTLNKLLETPIDLESYVQNMIESLIHRSLPSAEALASLVESLENGEFKFASSLADVVPALRRVVHFTIVVDALVTHFTNASTEEEVTSLDFAIEQLESMQLDRKDSVEHTQAANWKLCSAISKIMRMELSTIRGAQSVCNLIRFHILLMSNYPQHSNTTGTQKQNALVGLALADAIVEQRAQFRRNTTPWGNISMNRDWIELYRLWNLRATLLTGSLDVITRQLAVLFLPINSIESSTNTWVQKHFLAMFLASQSNGVRPVVDDVQASSSVQRDDLHLASSIMGPVLLRYVARSTHLAPLSPTQDLDHAVAFVQNSLIVALDGFDYSMQSVDDMLEKTMVKDPIHGSKKQLVIPKRSIRESSYRSTGNRPSLLQLKDADSNRSLSFRLSTGFRKQVTLVEDHLILQKFDSSFNWIQNVPFACVSLLVRMFLMCVFIPTLLASFIVAWWLLYESELITEVAIISLLGPLVIAACLFSIWSACILVLLHGRDRNSDKLRLPFAMYAITQSVSDWCTELTIAMFGTVLFKLHCRLHGAKIGRNVFILSPHMMEHFKLTFGDNCILDTAYAVGHQFTDHSVQVGPVVIQPETTLHPGSLALANSNPGGIVKPRTLVHERVFASRDELMDMQNMV